MAEDRKMDGWTDGEAGRMDGRTTPNQTAVGGEY